MIITLEGPMGSGMTMMATYMAFRLRKELDANVKFDYIGLDKRVKVWPKCNINIEDYNEKI
jgi:Ni2+-binding GTPase involved in maturation of urease and hydrogenase